MAKQKRPKAGIKRGKPTQVETDEKYSRNAVVDFDGSEMQKIYDIFGVSDNDEVQDIIDGHISHDGY